MDKELETAIQDVDLEGDEILNLLNNNFPPKINEIFDEIINKIVSQGGSIVFSKQQYQFLDTDSCYWLAQKYGTTKAFAIRRKDDKTLELYGEDINNTCKFVPAIKIKKESNLNE